MTALQIEVIQSASLFSKYDTIAKMETNSYALVIDDELQVRSFVADVLRKYGWNVSEAASAEEAFELLNKQKWLLIFCDVMLGVTDGYAVLRRFAEQESKTRFVIMTGYESGAGALDATAYGADEYLTKPFTVADILEIANKVREQSKARLKSDKTKIESDFPDYVSDLHLIGTSPKFVECLKMVGRIAPTNLPVLITGEPGTGKEVIARAIHRRSNRASGPFVAVSCGTILTELLDSEIFGHVRGSSAGPDRERLGLCEEANGGTLFLDEITETNPLFQAKLLRVLQKQEIRRVGSNLTKKVDVRVIAATNRDVEEEVKAGRFRGDLMYRLNNADIRLPSLSERVRDIPLLALHFARQIKRSTTSPIVFSEEAMEILKNYYWPGNIRELENAVDYAVSLCSGTVYPEHLPLRIRHITAEPSIPKSAGFISDIDGEKWADLEEIKAQYIEKVLIHTKGNKQAATKILNIDRKTIDRIIKLHNN